jgi:Mg2+/Co2+ transporter CorB
MPLALQLIILFLFVTGASFFAGSETGFVSWNPLKVGHRAASGDIVARWALFLVKHKDRLLSAQLIGNNICIVGATLVFASLVETVSYHYHWNLMELPSPESWFLTPLLALFGEMLPKSLFRMYPFRLTLRSIPVLMGVYFVTLPFTWAFTSVTGLFKRDISKKGESFMTKVREEMVLVAMEGSRTGTLFRSADRFIQNVLAMNEKKLRDVFTASNAADQTVTRNCFDSTRTAGEVKRQMVDGEGILIAEADNSITRYIPMSELAVLPDEVRLSAVGKPLPRFDADLNVPAAIRLLDVNQPFVLVCGKDGYCLGVMTTHLLLREALRGG